MQNNRPDYDKEIQAIADYVLAPAEFSELASQTAFYTLFDSLACAMLALNYPACVKLLGPLVPESRCDNGVLIPGTEFCLDPVQAAFNIGAMIRWLDFNDTWLAAEWGHPSDNLGAILALTSYANQCRGQTYTIESVLECMIMAHEIQGVLALENAFNAVGLDHVMLVKIASTAVSCRILQLNREQTCTAISHAWLDGQALRTYRHAPNTGSRKSWAAGDATSRAVRLALLAANNEMGYPSAITAPTWGFQDALFRQQTLQRDREYGDYVMENVLWKISFPAEFHAQTAVECALVLHPQIKARLDEIDCIEIQTQAAAVRIIDKQGPLHNPADRDHCLQYMIAIGLLFGELNADHYEDDVASDPRIDALRAKMQVAENPQFTTDYFAADKRAIGNAITVIFNDGSKTDTVSIDYPIGHRRRRDEGIPKLISKYEAAVKQRFDASQAQTLIKLIHNQSNCQQLPVDEFLATWAQLSNMSVPV